MNDFDITVAEMMKEFGFTATYVKRTLGEYDPTIGEAPLVEKKTPVEAILLDFTLQSNGLGSKFGTMIQAGDKNLLVRPPNKSKEGVPPLSIDSTTDSVVINGAEYKVVTMKEINPTGGDSLIYDLLIRK